MPLSSWTQDVSILGFYLFRCELDEPLSSIARRIGRPVPSAPGRPDVDMLTPKRSDDSQPGTLSFLHGFNAFPFHTETAHWRDPVDWVILRCTNPGSGNRPTLLIDGWNLGLTEDNITLLTQSLMVVKNGAKSFLAPLVTRECERLTFRHDPGCIKPATKGDKASLDLLERSLMNSTQKHICWNSGLCLIFDNRRMLHSRAESDTADPDRQLERIYVVKE